MLGLISLASRSEDYPDSRDFPRAFAWVSHVIRCRKTTRSHHPAEASISKMGAWITLPDLTPSIDPDDPTVYNGMLATNGKGRLNQKWVRKDTAQSVYTLRIIYPLKWD